ncbi:MAG: type II secretion system protein, partial [Rickettsiales bacterium]
MTKQYKNKAIRGFTLVELSIVIVIIGFLVAGIAAGTSLIEEAKLRSVVTDFDTFKTAFNGFSAKYNAVPGDTQNGEAFFPNCASATGNGDCVGANTGFIVATNV